jgi:predicted MPP superfamily phosphohydrolase
MFVPLGLWLLMHAYVVWRAASVPPMTGRVPRMALVAAAAVLCLSLPLPRLLERWGAVGLARALEPVGMTWLGVVFLVVVCLLAADVATGFGLLVRRFAPVVRGSALAAAGALSVIALVQGHRPPVVRDYVVRLPGLPADADGTVLVAVSDFHLGTLLGERWLAARVGEVEALRPDAVVALGDMVEGHGGVEGALVPVLRRLRAPLGVWGVTGNHEYHGGAGSRARVLEEAGFRVLHDTWAEARPGLVFAGVDDLTSRRRSGRDSGAVQRALAGRPPGAATVLLSHSPLRAEEAARAGAGLMLCAHTHAGQIWPFTYLSRLEYPLNAGRYVVAGMPVIVSRGTGTWGPRMRLWRPGEILRITLRAN